MTNPYYSFFNIQSEDELELCLIKAYNELHQALYSKAYQQLLIA